jgi:hypothetical protein
MPWIITVKVALKAEIIIYFMSCKYKFDETEGVDLQALQL